MSILALSFLFGFVGVLIYLMLSQLEDTREIADDLVFLLRATPQFCFGEGLLKIVFAYYEALLLGARGVERALQAGLPGPWQAGYARPAPRPAAGGAVPSEAAKARSIAQFMAGCDFHSVTQRNVREFVECDLGLRWGALDGDAGFRGLVVDAVRRVKRLEGGAAPDLAPCAACLSLWQHAAPAAAAGEGEP